MIGEIVKAISNLIILEKQTIQGLSEVLNRLVENGYGDFPIIRPDMEAGPMNINQIQLYNTEQEFECGELLEKRYFLI